MKQRKILIVEDDESFAYTLEDFLEESGYDIDLAFDAKEAMHRSYESNYDLCLFDINIPHFSGIELFKLLNESGKQIPTIFITSYKDIDTIRECFSHGCEDFMKKPIDIYELLYRIEAIFLRHYGSSKKIILNKFTYFDIKSRCVYQNDHNLLLQPKIIQLLELFIKNSNHIVSKNQIIDHLWSTNEEFSEGAIRVYVNKLKNIIGENRLINIRKIGYKLLL